jgi:capsular polysaccharide biosynthesis protein
LVYGPSSTRLPPPFYCADSRIKPRPSQLVWPQFGVAEIPGGRLLDHFGWVVGQKDTFLAEFCGKGFSRQSAVNRLLKLKPPEHLNGITLNLCSAFSFNNFFHAIVDGLSRWHLVQKAGYTWDSFDHVVLPMQQSRMTQEIERAIGVPAEKIIRLTWHQQLECANLVQPSFPGYHALTAWWVPDFYRALFPPSGSLGRRKLYVPRHGVRQIIHAAEIETRLAALGFEVFDPSRGLASIATLQEASHIVGVHGAALANLVFCPPGTRVLELMPSDIAYHENSTFYASLCAAAGLPYGMLVGPSKKNRFTSISPQTDADFAVPLAEFEQAMQALLDGK